MTFVTMLLFQDLERIRYLVLTIALSIAAFGVRSGVVGLLTGFASLQYVYPDQSFIADNNDLALALNLVLPLLLLLGQIERRPLLKAGFYAIFGLSILGVLSTFSRGGFLGLAATIAMLVARSRRRLLNLTLLILGGFLVASLLSTSWYERIASISEYEEDGSAQGRLQAWTVATKLALDSPLTGWGFRSLQPETYWKYGFDTVRKELVAHSIFFQVLGDQGFVGLGLFLALVGSAIVSLQRVALLSAITPSRIGLAGLARAIQTGLIGFLVSGAFLSRAYFDLPYHLIAIAVVLTTLAGSEASGAAEGTDAVAAAASWPLPVRAR
jgi:probable O-glycosylation ligase (exosortase A-associated)